MSTIGTPTPGCVPEPVNTTFSMLGCRLEGRNGPVDPYVGWVLVSMGNALGFLQRFAEAEAVYQRTIAIAEKLHRPDYIAAALNDLSVIYGKQGRYADAIPLAERSLVERAKVKKGDDPDLEPQLFNLGLYYREVGRDKDAETTLFRAYAGSLGVDLSFQGFEAELVGGQ